MTRNTQKGNTVVFSSGLLTPEWVIERLRCCEEDLTSQAKVVQNIIVIVIDACYSGTYTWKTRMQQHLNNDPLKFTCVILQMSCGEDEVSDNPMAVASCLCFVHCKMMKHMYIYSALSCPYKDEEVIDEIELLYDQTPNLL